MTDERDPGQPSEPHPSEAPAQTPPPAPPTGPTEPAPPAGYRPPAGYAPPAGPPYAPGPYHLPGDAAPRPGKGLAIAALVVGIAAFLGAFIPFLNYVVFVPAVVAVVLGIVSLVRKADGKPLAITGLALGALGLVLSIVLAIVYTAAFVSVVQESVESSTVQPSPADPQPSDGGDPGADEAQPGTSAEDPLPLGTTVTGEGADGPEWEMTLGTPILDGTAAVLAANSGNAEPDEGMQYAIIPVTVKYVGTSSGEPLSELGVGFLAADGSQYSAADSVVVAPAPAFTSEAATLAPQATATGNVVVQIPIADAEAGVWAAAPGTYADLYYFTQQ